MTHTISASYGGLRKAVFGRNKKGGLRVFSKKRGEMLSDVERETKLV